MSPLTSSGHGTCAQLQQFQVTPGWDMTLWHIFDAVCFDRSPVFHVRPLVVLRSLLNIQSKWRPFFRIVMRSLYAIMSVSYHLKVSNPWQSLLQADTQSEITCPHDTATLCNACWPKFWQWRRNLSCIQASHRVCDTNHRILLFQSLPLQWNIRKRTQGRLFALASRLKRSLKPNKDWRSLKIIESSFKGALDAGATGAALDAGATGAIEGTSILSLDERSSVTSVVTSRLKDGNWNGCRLKIYIPSYISATNIMTVVTS